MCVYFSTGNRNQLNLSLLPSLFMCLCLCRTLVFSNTRAHTHTLSLSLTPSLSFCLSRSSHSFKCHRCGLGSSLSHPSASIHGKRWQNIWHPENFGSSHGSSASFFLLLCAHLYCNMCWFHCSYLSCPSSSCKGLYSGRLTTMHTPLCVCVCVFGGAMWK